MTNRKALLQEMVDQLWNPQPSTTFERYYTDDFRNHDPSAPAETTREELQQAALDIAVGFPDYSVTILDMVEEGDKVAKRFVFRGTHSGPYQGIPATGRSVESTGVCIYRFAGDKVAECWWSRDVLTMLQQMGVVPALDAPSMA